MNIIYIASACMKGNTIQFKNSKGFVCTNGSMWIKESRDIRIESIVLQYYIIKSNLNELLYFHTYICTIVQCMCRLIAYYIEAITALIAIVQATRQALSHFIKHFCIEVHTFSSRRECLWWEHTLNTLSFI